MQLEFEKYLKNSNHFRDVVNTHRAATARLVAGLAGLLVQDKHVAGPAIGQLLKRLEEPDPNVSGNTAEASRLLVALVRDALRADGVRIT